MRNENNADALEEDEMLEVGRELVDLVQGTCISGGEKNFTNSGNQLPLVELVKTAYSVGKKI